MTFRWRRVGSVLPKGPRIRALQAPGGLEVRRASLPGQRSIGGGPDGARRVRRAAGRARRHRSVQVGDHPLLLERPRRDRIRREGLQDHSVSRAPLRERDRQQPVTQLRLRQLPRYPRRHERHVAHVRHAHAHRVPPRHGRHPHRPHLLRRHARRVRLRAHQPRGERERHARPRHGDERGRTRRCVLTVQLQPRLGRARPGHRRRVDRVRPDRGRHLRVGPERRRVRLREHLALDPPRLQPGQPLRLGQRRGEPRRRHGHDRPRVGPRGRLPDEPRDALEGRGVGRLGDHPRERRGRPGRGEARAHLARGPHGVQGPLGRAGRVERVDHAPCPRGRARSRPPSTPSRR